MADHHHHYEVELTNGDKYKVTTPNHHDNHTLDVFLGHLVDILKSIVAGVATHHINNFVYKGKVPLPKPKE